MILEPTSLILVLEPQDFFFGGLFFVQKIVTQMIQNVSRK